MATTGCIIKINIVSFFVLLGCLLSAPIYNLMFLNIYSSAQYDNCPLCYGKTMCSCFTSGDFTLDWNYFLSNLINIGWKTLINKKIVIYGYCFSDKVVVKLSPDYQINNKTNGYDVNLGDFNQTEITVKSLHLNNILNNFMLCPNDDKLSKLLLPLLTLDENSDKLAFSDLKSYMMEVNVEPFIQQLTKDWAVAKYLGGCGRVAVSKNCGQSLTSVTPQLNWTLRASAAIQLLQFAFNATFANLDFGFYFTDMSPDNFAISPEGEVRLVDLENVIIVDKFPKDHPADWGIWHTNYHDDSANEFIFSTKEICSHQINDLNIYAICQGILSDQSDLLEGGLLRSCPSHIEGMIKRCISPSPGDSRFEIAELIMEALNTNRHGY